jgi:hypothetical protein
LLGAVKELREPGIDKIGYLVDRESFPVLLTVETGSIATVPLDFCAKKLLPYAFETQASLFRVENRFLCTHDQIPTFSTAPTLTSSVRRLQSPAVLALQQATVTAFVGFSFNDEPTVNFQKRIDRGYPYLLTGLTSAQ